MASLFQQQWPPKQTMSCTTGDDMFSEIVFITTVHSPGMAVLFKKRLLPTT